MGWRCVYACLGCPCPSFPPQMPIYIYACRGLCYIFQKVVILCAHKNHDAGCLSSLPSWWRWLKFLPPPFLALPSCPPALLLMVVVLQGGLAPTFSSTCRTALQRTGAPATQCGRRWRTQRALRLLGALSACPPTRPAGLAPCASCVTHCLYLCTADNNRR